VIPQVTRCKITIDESLTFGTQLGELRELGDPIILIILMSASATVRDLHAKITWRYAIDRSWRLQRSGVKLSWETKLAQIDVDPKKGSASTHGDEKWVAVDAVPVDAVNVVTPLSESVVSSAHEGVAGRGWGRGCGVM